MWLLDQWAERHILDAQRNGDFDNLPGSGEPITFDDDSHVPAELRTGYRMLKNAGCLPPEMQQRKDALALVDLLKTVDVQSDEHQSLSKKLMLLELKLCQAGVSTDFLRGEYADKLMRQIDGGR